MDWHPGEDDLIFRLHGDGSVADRERVSEHLRGCATCRAAWEELQSTLTVVTTAAVPEPDADFEQRMWARVQPALRPAPPRWSWRPLVPIGAWAATVAAIVFAGYTWRPAVVPEAAATAPATNETSGGGLRERVLLTALDQHFADTEMLLVELVNAPEVPADGGFEFERTSADDLVASGRLYRETAIETGDAQLAAMLEDLEGVLVEVARSAETPAADDVGAWREQIERGDLLFKVRAATNDIRDRRNNMAEASKGAL
jgi:hypothetical protein